MSKERLVVYTTAVGLPFDLKPVSAEQDVDFVCLTDRNDIEPNGWTIRKVEPVLKADPFRSSREIKICAHRYFPEYRKSIYLDTKVQIERTATELWDYLMPKPELVFGALQHSFRNSIQDEFRSVRKARLDHDHILDEQLLDYQRYYAEFVPAKPIWGGLLARYHMHPLCIEAMDNWLAHVFRYSRRDQLSLPIALSAIPDEKKIIHAESIAQTQFHCWPVTSMKDQDYRKTAGSHTRGNSGHNSTRNEAGRNADHIDHPDTPPSNDRVTFGFSASAQLFFAESPGRDKLIHVSHPKRLDLYNQGINRRIRRVLSDYRLDMRLVTKGDTVVDVGANVGEIGFWAMRNGAEYFGFEPDPAAFKALTLNCPNGRLFEIGLSDKAGTAAFFLDTANADSTLFDSGGTGNRIEIEIARLDDLLTLHAPDRPIRLLKVEAEGMEPEVLRGAKETLSRCAYVAIDAGPERGGERTAPDVEKLMLSEGYEIVDSFARRGTILFRRV